MLKFVIPFVFAFVAILQDAHVIIDYDGCTKDNQLLAILIFLLMGAISRRLLVRGFWVMLVVFQAAFFAGDAYLGDFLPDTWSATEARLFDGYPIIQVGSVFLVSVLAFTGLLRHQIKLAEAIKCVLGSVLIIISAQLWIIGNQNIEKAPWRGWNSAESTEKIVMTDPQNQFIGQKWVMENTDYNCTISKLKAFWVSGESQHYFVAPHKGHKYPFIYKLGRTDTNQIILEAQARDMDWGKGMVWIWEYVASFILVFLETFMITQTLLGLLIERRFLSSARESSNL